VLGAPALAAAPCQDGVLPGGALSRICVPAPGWNGELVVWAHGYVAVDEPIGFYHLTLPDGTSLPDLVLGLGLAFATTSYRANGLVILDAVDDVRELVAAFPAAAGRAASRVYLAGASEGGLVTVLALERHPELFTAGLAGCGPIGSFAGQIDYVGDFRVLFDYFFPGVLPGDPFDVPASVMDDWDAVHVPAITAAIAAAPDAARQLVAVARAATAGGDPASLAETAVNVLWYNAFGANDVRARLGGNPYGNRGRLYLGSRNDLRLNLRVRRVTADAAARSALAGYETSGRLTRPLVTLHTGGDEVIPFWHEQRYYAKAQPSGAGHFLGLPVDRFGHCAFEATDVLRAFALLRWQLSRR
jgi:pimeloyl-ACP methyl ester carboxylesterase